MRPVEWVDEKGYMRRRLVKDSDPDELGALGFPEEPPDIDQLDWEDVKRTLHNQLMARRIITHKDVQRTQVGATGAVRAALLKPLIALFREEERLRRK